MRFTCAARTDVGVVRSGNEDSYLMSSDRGMFIVADGMGGHAVGEKASAKAVQEIPLTYAKHAHDGALAAILFDLGFDPPAGKLMFIVGRIAGLTAEVAEEYAREKPMHIKIPVEYDGEPPRALKMPE